MIGNIFAFFLGLFIGAVWSVFAFALASVCHGTSEEDDDEEQEEFLKKYKERYEHES